MLYAQLDFINKRMYGKPQSLPSEWRDGSGAVITKFNQFSNTALAFFGWLPVEKEVIREGYELSTDATYDEGNAKFVYRAVPVDLAVLMADSEMAIDKAASQACERYISTGVGQDMRYLAKYGQAFEYTAQEVPSDDDYPMLSVEAEACGMTVAEKAAEIIAIYDQWTALAGQVEALRIGGKKAIRAMDNVDDVVTKRDEVIALLGEL